MRTSLHSINSIIHSMTETERSAQIPSIFSDREVYWYEWMRIIVRIFFPHAIKINVYHLNKIHPIVFGAFGVVLKDTFFNLEFMMKERLDGTTNANWSEMPQISMNKSVVRCLRRRVMPICDGNSERKVDVRYRAILTEPVCQKCVASTSSCFVSMYNWLLRLRIRFGGSGNFMFRRFIHYSASHLDQE